MENNKMPVMLKAGLIGLATVLLFAFLLVVAIVYVIISTAEKISPKNQDAYKIEVIEKPINKKTVYQEPRKNKQVKVKTFPSPVPSESTKTILKESLKENKREFQEQKTTVIKPTVKITPKVEITVKNEILDILNSLEVKNAINDDSYNREKFPHWKKMEGEKCNADDLSVKNYANVELLDGCREVAGQMKGKYTGEELKWGKTRNNVIDIDHVVSLKNAWLTGAFRFSEKELEIFANDQDNLIPVKASANRAKGASDAASWLPENKNFHCEYVSKQTKIKHKYKLWVTPAEKETMIEVLNNCSNKH